MLDGDNDENDINLIDIYSNYMSEDALLSFVNSYIVKAFNCSWTMSRVPTSAKTIVRSEALEVT